jgi:uncharacterized SAM-dependent methyltransferase
LDIINKIGDEAALIEFGSGSSTKVKILLNQLSHLAYYIPIDISNEMLVNSARVVEREYEGVKVIPICADFTKKMKLPSIHNKGKKVIFYPGSTIGNFEPIEAIHLLSKAKTMLNKGDGLLIGVDLKKDLDILHQAYNDPAGIT